MLAFACSGVGRPFHAVSGSSAPADCEVGCASCLALPSFGGGGPAGGFGLGGGAGCFRGAAVVDCALLDAAALGGALLDLLRVPCGSLRGG